MNRNTKYYREVLDCKRHLGDGEVPVPVVADTWFMICLEPMEASEEPGGAVGHHQWRRERGDVGSPDFLLYRLQVRARS